MHIPTFLRRGTREWTTYGSGLVRWTSHLSTFEKVIIANSAIIVLDTLAGWWITQENPATYHYMIDTAFIALAVVLGLLVNFLLLRAAFRPLRTLLLTIRAVEKGDLQARARVGQNEDDVGALARAFNAMLDQVARSRNEVAERVLRAQEDERRRLALELHDQTGQSLTALVLHAEAIGQRLAGETSTNATQARQQAEHLSALAQQTLAEVQALSRQLRPAMLDDLGLPAALRWLADDARIRLGIEVRVVTNGSERLQSDIETALFRIAQESLTNAARHGRATRSGCRIHQSAGSVSMVIADNGEGFTGKAAYSRYGEDTSWPHRQGGLGLEGMQARLRPLGGTLAVRSRPGQGWWVRAWVPLSSPAPVPPEEARQQERVSSSVRYDSNA